jgi:hypothetical protein
VPSDQHVFDRFFQKKLLHSDWICLSLKKLKRIENYAKSVMKIGKIRSKDPKRTCPTHPPTANMTPLQAPASSFRRIRASALTACNFVWKEGCSPACLLVISLLLLLSAQSNLMHLQAL